MKKIFASSILISCLSLAGCDDGPKLVPAEGTLTLGGAPLAEAGIVVMYPDGNSASGSSDKDGKFTLTYLGRNGAVPGTDLKVGVSKQENPYGAAAGTNPTGPPKSKEEEDAMMKNAMDMMAKQAAEREAKLKKGGAVLKDLIDAKYRNADTSGLKLTIPEGGSKELKIDLP